MSRDVLTDESIGAFVENMLRCGDAASLARLSNADVSAVRDMEYLFFSRSLTGVNLASWDTSNVRSMDAMFERAKFAGEVGLSRWNTGRVVTMHRMFADAVEFNEAIGTWDTSQVTSMSEMFLNARQFNQPIGAWDTSQVTSMSEMFLNACQFNQPIGAWNTSRVTDMCAMFFNATTFNQPIGAWDTSQVTTMSAMFGADLFFDGSNMVCIDFKRYYSVYAKHAFQQSIDSWDVSNLRDVRGFMHVGYAMPFAWRQVHATIQSEYDWIQTQAARMRCHAAHTTLHLMARIQYASAKTPRGNTTPLTTLLASWFETPFLLEMMLPAEVVCYVVAARVARNKRTGIDE